MAQYQNIIYEVKDRIARITLNRPEKMNALSWQLRQDIVNGLKEAEHDDNVGCVILKGAGRAFSAGYDITPVEPSPNRPPGGVYYSETLDRIMGAMIHERKDTWMTIWNLHKVVIAQVHGYCLAGASEVANMCDLFFVAEDAIIGYPPVRGLGTVETNYFPWKLPMSKAKLMALTGTPITGKQAADWGMATASFPADKLEQETERFARGVASISIDLLASSKRKLNRAYEIMGFRTAMDVGSDIGGYGGFRPSGGEFNRISRAYGLRAALLWQNGPFGDYGQPYTPREKFFEAYPRPTE
ncbi:MAG: enoyl-CoA hydratase/isomerase family protein [Chloroflexi bacterium]|nr:enoyl-CoA hydratase/isomerase family protein [Chloroflexota bacterium]